MRVDEKEKRKFTYLENPTKTLEIISENLDKYDTQIISYAKQLKYQHENDNNTGVAHHSDDEYLKIAAKHISIHRIHAVVMKKDKNAVSNPVPDPNYRPYSYLEILQMANNGANIPRDVLYWAKAQEESDITAYEVISDEAMLDNNDSTEENITDSDINNLRTIAKENLAKSAKQLNKSDEQTDDVSNFAQKARQIVQDSKSLISKAKDNLTPAKNDRLNELANKSKNGQLTDSEKSEYNQLQKNLDNKDKIKNDIQIRNEELERFLDSIDTLNKYSADSEKISSEAIKSGQELAKLDEQYSATINKTHDANALRFGTSGLLINILSDLSAEAAPDLTVIKGYDLDELTLNINRVIGEETLLAQTDFAGTEIVPADKNEPAVETNINVLKEDSPEDVTITENPEENNDIVEFPEETLAQDTQTLEPEETFETTIPNEQNELSVGAEENTLPEITVEDEVQEPALSEPEPETEPEQLTIASEPQTLDETDSKEQMIKTEPPENEITEENNQQQETYNKNETQNISTQVTQTTTNTVNEVQEPVRQLPLTDNNIKSEQPQTTETTETTENTAEQTVENETSVTEAEPEEITENKIELKQNSEQSRAVGNNAQQDVHSAFQMLNRMSVTAKSNVGKEIDKDYTLNKTQEQAAIEVNINDISFKLAAAKTVSDGDDKKMQSLSVRTTEIQDKAKDLVYQSQTLNDVLYDQVTKYEEKIQLNTPTDKDNNPIQERAETETEKEEDTKELDEITARADNHLNEIVEVHDPTRPDTNASLVATVATFANVKPENDDDSKAERRLTRFNRDSSINSRKKHKKVVAVAQTTTNSKQKK